MSSNSLSAQLDYIINEICGSNGDSDEDLQQKFRALSADFSQLFAQENFGTLPDIQDFFKKLMNFTITQPIQEKSYKAFFLTLFTKINSEIQKTEFFNNFQDKLTNFHMEVYLSVLCKCDSSVFKYREEEIAFVLYRYDASWLIRKADLLLQKKIFEIGLEHKKFINTVLSILSTMEQKQMDNFLQEYLKQYKEPHTYDQENRFLEAKKKIKTFLEAICDSKKSKKPDMLDEFINSQLKYHDNLIKYDQTKETEKHLREISDKIKKTKQNQADELRNDIQRLPELMKALEPYHPNNFSIHKLVNEWLQSSKQETLNKLNETLKEFLTFLPEFRKEEYIKAFITDIKQLLPAETFQPEKIIKYHSELYVIRFLLMMLTKMLTNIPETIYKYLRVDNTLKILFNLVHQERTKYNKENKKKLNSLLIKVYEPYLNHATKYYLIQKEVNSEKLQKLLANKIIKLAEMVGLDQSYQALQCIDTFESKPRFSEEERKKFQSYFEEQNVPSFFNKFND